MDNRTADKNYQKAYERQKVARIAAEQMLEDRSRELHDSYQALQDAYDKMKNQKAQIIHQEKLASIGQLAAGVAHEINNPTGYVKSNINSLKRYLSTLSQFVQQAGELCAAECPLEERKLRYSALLEEFEIDYIFEDGDDLVDESLDGVTRIEDIVKNLKHFSRPDDGDNIRFQVNECIDSALKLVHNEIKYTASVIRQFADDLPPQWGQPGSLSQVFLNIIVNAAHAIENRGEITITTRAVKDGVEIDIADTGSGIAEELRSRIFDPFFTTKEVGVGTGLGLSVSHAIIKKHGGTINFVSEVGKGTTFTIYLPIAHL